jgi:tripartite-type tricarboxylate transporter receptor subunit TctC
MSRSAGRMDQMMNRAWVAILCFWLGAIALLSSGCATQADYPTRPLTLVVPWAAGGGTDAVARVIAGLIERDLGKPVNVVNRTGGSGVVGHQTIAAARPDGYTIGIITVEIAMMHHQGLTDLTGAAFTPLGLINFDGGAVLVRADSPYNTLGDLLQAIRTNPGKLNASGTAQGGIWHVALAGLLDEQKIPPASVVWVPSNGSAPAMLDLVAGGIDLVVASHPESRSLIDAGKVRSLAILDETPSALYPKVPTGTQAVGSKWTMGAWRGIAAPANLPAAIQSTLQTAVKKAYDSQEYRDFMATRGFGMRWADPQEFAALMSLSDKQMGAVMKAVGLAK